MKTENSEGIGSFIFRTQGGSASRDGVVVSIPVSYQHALPPCEFIPCYC